jgi:signal transduction histidine kinase
MRAWRDRVVGFVRERLDMLITIAVIVELQLEFWLNSGIPESHRLPTAIVIVAFAAPIAIRRRRPALALVLCTAVAAVQALLGLDLMSANGILVPPIVLAYTVGARLDLRQSLTPLALGFCLFTLTTLLAPPAPGSPSEAAQDLAFVGLLFAAPWFVGRLARERDRRTAAFSQLAASAAAEREERERAAVAGERLRIGGELQDIIAHSVSAMVIQTSAARQLLQSHPERARESILTVEQTGRDTLSDLRRLLGILRRDDDAHALAPQPGLDQLSALTRSLAGGGLACELRVEGTRIDLTPGIDLVGYRVAEAALRSAAQHGSRRASVTIHYRPHDLGLEIRGDGHMPDLDGELQGMSERVALYDGSLRPLAVAGERFGLEARLPFAGAVPA